MDTRDREAIEGLFTKLADVERQAGPRDAEAEGFIADRLARQSGAPYYMAQTIVMQDLALANQQARIAELERSAAQPPRSGGEGGGLLSRMLGGSGTRSVPSVGPARPGGAWGSSGQNNAAPYGQPGGQGFGRSGGMGGMGGGGFLAGAAQTAMGVAGGVLLGNAVMGMFSGDEAQAAEAPADDTAADEPAVDETAADDGGWFGGDDGGGFDEI